MEPSDLGARAEDMAGTAVPPAACKIVSPGAEKFLVGAAFAMMSLRPQRTPPQDPML